MRVTYCAGCIAIILLLSGIASAEDAATVHGVAYEWDTFNPLDNAVIEVNSTPVQSMVAKYGVYSFELSKGTYCIVASYYKGDHLTYCGENVITVSDGGNYVVDMLLLPSYSNVTVEEDIEHATKRSSDTLFIVSLFIVFILLASLFYQVRKRPQKEPLVKEYAKKSSISVCKVKVNPTEEKDTCHFYLKPGIQAVNGLYSNPRGNNYAPTYLGDVKGSLSSEHQEIIDIVKSHGGTMSQRELRKLLAYSEGKVSVMLLDLEKTGKIRKVRKGRGNILFLTESEK